MTELIEQAKAGDPIAAIRLVRLEDADRPPEDPLGIARLKLGPPRRAVYPDVPRRLAAVDEDLADLFGRLCAGQARWPLLLWGEAGTGKTMAALCFCDLVRVSRYFSLDEACSAVMKGTELWSESFRLKGEEREPRLLVVDELGERSKVGDLQYTTLKAMLDYQEFRHRRLGIYVSNLSPADLVKLFDDRIVSRLTAGSVVHLTGDDRRQNRKD